MLNLNTTKKMGKKPRDVPCCQDDLVSVDLLTILTDDKCNIAVLGFVDYLTHVICEQIRRRIHLCTFVRHDTVRGEVDRRAGWGELGL